MSVTHRFALAIGFACLAPSAWADDFRRDADIAIGGGAGYSIAFLPDGKQVVVGGNHRDGGVLQVWDVGTNKLVREFKGHTDEVWAVAVSPDAKYIAPGRGTEPPACGTSPAARKSRSSRSSPPA